MQIGGKDNGSLGSFEKTIGGESAGVLNFDSQSNLWTDVSVGTVGSNSSRNSEAFRNTLNLSNTNGGNNNGYLGILEGTGGCKSTGVISVSSSLWTNDSVDNIWSNHRRNSEIFWNTLRLNGANNTDCMRTTNINGGNNNGTLGILEGTAKCRSTGVYTGDVSSRLRTDVSMDSTGMSCVGSSEAFWNTLNVI